jgi:hypothetical protein
MGVNILWLLLLERLWNTVGEFIGDWILHSNITMSEWRFSIYSKSFVRIKHTIQGNRTPDTNWWQKPHRCIQLRNNNLQCPFFLFKAFFTWSKQRTGAFFFLFIKLCDWHKYLKNKCYKGFQLVFSLKLYGKMYKFISTFTVKFYFIFYNHLTNLNWIINCVLRIIF